MLLRSIRPLVFALTLCLPVAAAMAAPGDGAAPSAGLACVSRPGPGEVDTVECTIEPAVAARSLRFQADFVGSHDDTVLSMTATLDGAPLVCAEGSRTRLVGEDGEVSLDCRFPVAAGGAARTVFVANVRWSHAQYVGQALRPQ